MRDAPEGELMAMYSAVKRINGVVCSRWHQEQELSFARSASRCQGSAESAKSAFYERPFCQEKITPLALAKGPESPEKKGKKGPATQKLEGNLSQEKIRLGTAGVGWEGKPT